MCPRLLAPAIPACPLCVLRPRPRRYEQLSIPIRFTFPQMVLANPFFIFLDIFLNTFEVAWLMQSRRNANKSATIAIATGAAAKNKQTYSRLTRDLLTIAVLHVGRLLALTTGVQWVWFAAQAVRCRRVFDLVDYMQQINGDLKTNVQVRVAAT
jgi:hypothetical protein